MATTGWFRNVETVGLERVPLDRPVLLVANHMNGFVDPVLLVATGARVPRFLAKSALWKAKPLGAVLDLIGVLPVHRRSDGDTAGNDRTFEACHRVLGEAGVIGLFPEGTVRDEPSVGEVRTGAARIALGARAAGVERIAIVPVGLTYEDKAAPRSRALVRVGEIIDLDAEIGRFAEDGEVASDADHGAVDRLTAAIADVMRGAAVDFTDRWEAGFLTQAAAIRLRTADMDPVAPVPLAALEPVARRLSLAPPAAQREIVTEMALYRLGLDTVKMRDADVLAGPDRNRIRGRVGPRVAKVGVLAPLAAFGVAVNGLPYLAVQRASDRPMARVSRANFSLLASLVAYPVAWLASSVVLRRRLTWPQACVTMAVLGPVSGRAAIEALEEGETLWRSRHGYRQALRHAADLPRLLEQRQKVVAAVDAALAAAVTATPGA
jgi:1-acyl-sn-glycerol-3-phosphate acyltransferase